MPDLVDSHVHLDMLENPERELEDASSAGVNRILAVGIDIESSRKAADFANKYAGINASVGIHPHDATSVGVHEINEIRCLAGLEGVVAIGETGLDYYRNRSPRADQEEAFIAHIELARQTGRTLIVHSRDAARETLDILKSNAQGITVVLHCFAMYEHVVECIRAGYFMSIAGNITFKNADRLRQAVAAIPDNLLLTETDSPYLSPAPHRGRPSSPKYIPHIVRAIASIRGVTTDFLASHIEHNFLTAFNIKQ